MSELRPGDRLADYLVERELGRGGMGAVYAARHERLDRRVALKVIVSSLAYDEEFRARFQREARIAATLEHPHVVPVHDVGEVDGVLFIAMRYIGGQDLASALKDHGPLAAGRVARLLAQVGSALDAAHAAGLVHRDVKPANVLLTESGAEEHAYLTDFGLTRDATSDFGLTGTGQWIGTIDYAAPEQIDAGLIDARTDVYAAACMAFHCLTGRVPFPGGAAAKLHGHLSGEPPAASGLVPDIEPAVDAVLARGMAKAPEDRFASAGDLARELTAAVSGVPNVEPERTVATGRALAGIQTVQMGADPRPEPARRLRPRPAPPAAPQPTARSHPPSRRLNPALLALGAVLLVGAGVGGALALTGEETEPARTATTPVPEAQLRTETRTVTRTSSAAPDPNPTKPARSSKPNPLGLNATQPSPATSKPTSPQVTAGRSEVRAN